VLSKIKTFASIVGNELDDEDTRKKERSYKFMIEIEKEGRRRERHHLAEFPYSNLPPELRKMVCDEYFLATHDLTLYHIRLLGEEGCALFEGGNTVTVELEWKTKPHFTALLAASRQVYYEAIHSYRRHFLPNNTLNINMSAFKSYPQLFSGPGLLNLESVEICLSIPFVPVWWKIKHKRMYESEEHEIVEQWLLREMINLRKLKICLCQWYDGGGDRLVSLFSVDTEKLRKLLKDAGIEPTVEIKKNERKDSSLQITGSL